VAPMARPTKRLSAVFLNLIMPSLIFNEFVRISHKFCVNSLLVLTHYSTEAYLICEEEIYRKSVTD